VTTGIFEAPINGCMRVGVRNPEGDRQAGRSAPSEVGAADPLERPER
jgi:hypothetical protein